MKSDLFDFGEEVMQQTWRIQDLIPKDSLIGVIAPSASAKSTFVNALFMYVLNNKNFLGKETEGCDILLIDQDSQEIGLKSRLKRLQNQLGTKKHDLYYKYMKRLYFKDGSIYKAIDKYPTAKLIVIDAFHKVGGKGFDFNGIEAVANSFEQLKTNCLNEYKGRSIIIITHGSEKREGMTADDYMATEDHAALAMGSSAFIESVDCYYILATPEKGGLVKSIYVRPVSKRVMLPADRLVVSLIQDNPNRMDIVYKKKWSAPDPEAVQHVIYYFETVGETATIEELIKKFEGQYKWNHFDKALKWLHAHGRVVYEVEASNRFRWRYIKNSDNETKVNISNNNETKVNIKNEPQSKLGN